jgi:hypothetical protein
MRSNKKNEKGWSGIITRTGVKTRRQEWNKRKAGLI